MPRSRGSDAPQRPSSQRAPLHLKTTTCSEANSVRHRIPAADRSPKVSPRGVSQERKRGTRATELETRLRKAQEELKKLREQLASAEVAKIEAEQALAKAKKRIPEAEEEKPQLPVLSPEEKPEEESVTSPATMDVFEVVVGENEIGSDQKQKSKALECEEEIRKGMLEKTEGDENNETLAAKEEEKSAEVNALKAKLLEKAKEVAILLEENAIFKTRAEDEAKQIAEAARAKEEELITKLLSMEEKLKSSRATEEQLKSQLEAAEGANATLEAEMKRLRVQTEQWRKAAEAAAAALATGDGAGDETAGRRVAERCRSMDKHFESAYISWGSPLMGGDMDEDGGGGRRKGAGMRMFGSLWRRNQNKKGDCNSLNSLQ